MLLQNLFQPIVQHLHDFIDDVLKLLIWWPIELLHDCYMFVRFVRYSYYLPRERCADLYLISMFFKISFI